MKDCLFCDRDSIKSEILDESKNFFVKVGVGILAPGHVMLISKDHMSCFAELPERLNKEFLLMKQKVFDIVKNNFFEPMIYEHGAYSQSIYHAHLHFVPAKNEYFNLQNIKDKIFLTLKSTQLENIFKIKEIFSEEGSYFYFEEKGKRWVFHTKGQPNYKFTFRKEFVRLTGLNGLISWESMPEEEKERNRNWVDVTKTNFKQ